MVAPRPAVGRAWHAGAMDRPPRFGRVVLVSGPESVLADRHVSRLIAEAREERPAASVARVAASSLDLGGLAEVTGGSLFATEQIVVIEGLDDLPADLFDAVVALVSPPVDDLALTLVHPGGVKGKGLLDRLKKAKVETVDCPALKTRDLPQFAVNEARRGGGRLDQATAATLVEAFGPDAQGIVGAVRQLLADAEDGFITDAVVRRYFAGRADVTSFTVADTVMAGRRDEALGQLRWALDCGVAPVLLCSAMAAALRNLGRYLDARDARLRDPELARAIGVPPWKISTLARQSQGWTQTGLAESIQVVARVDAEIKGAASDPGFSLEQLVIQVTGHHGRRPEASRN